MQNPVFDIQGHRGCRGLLPENTVPAFLKAVELGVTTLEMDVVISKDKKVVLSHEPFLSHEICYTSENEAISEKDEQKYNLYEMEYSQIQNCDCGSKIHLRFPFQQKMRIAKPLLSDVIDSVENYLKINKLAPVFYNIETKCLPIGDDIFHPKPAEFSELLYEIISKKGIKNRCTVQSFDVRTLQYFHQKYPDVLLVLLVENKESAAENIQKLGFVPQIYSPDFELVDQNLLDYCKKMGMRLIPWTINEEKEMLRLKNLGVNGIITDYPDKAIRLFGKK